MTAISLNLPKVRKCDLSLREVFESEKTRETVRRVIKYLASVYFNHSNKDFEAVSRPVAFVEEFFISMPTRAAFDAEIALCEAILAFSEGKISEGEMKDALKKFLDSHTFVYEWRDFGKLSQTVTRRQKDDSVFVFELQTQFYELIYGKTRVVCNPVQMWLIYLLEKSRDENLEFIARKL